MIEHEHECASPKRTHDGEQHPLCKRPRRSGSDDESPFSSSTDDEQSKADQTDDDSDADESDEHSDLATDQSRYAIDRRDAHPLSRYSSKRIKQFRYVHERCRRKSIEATRSNVAPADATQPCRWQLSSTFERADLVQTGYAVLSDERFPFHSLCYMCGSMGRDLLYCNSCCQAYHSACLNELERPQFLPTPESWVCPNCTICNICGLSINSSIISCFECRRRFHLQCLKQSKDEPHTAHLSASIWLCPLCIKCDCGQALASTERNLVPLNKSLASQQSLMCAECLSNMKIIRSNKNDDIERCHLCAKFIEQFSTKPKALFSVSLIGHRPPAKEKNLLQCTRCAHRFHPKCDGYLNEDVMLMPYVKSACASLICSKCDGSESEAMKAALMNFKLQAVKNTTASVCSTLQIMISEENRLNTMRRYLSNLQQLHQSRHRSVNLHAFLSDLLAVVQRLLDNHDSRQWQAAIDNCLAQHCPWYTSSNLSSNHRTLHGASTQPLAVLRCLTAPSIDHIYALDSDRLFFRSHSAKTNLLTSTDSLLRYIDNKLDERDTFENLHQIDTRICQLCQTYAEHYSATSARLIAIGINQWVHVGCLLPAYAKTLDGPPYILSKAREVVNRCRTKWRCDQCSKMGASVRCYEEECHTFYHCRCIEEYYAKFDRNVQEQWGMVSGLLPNLTTLCVKHSKTSRKNESDESNVAINLSQVKPVHLSSAIHADLSNSTVEFALETIHLCLGSLQIQSLGDFEYLLENDTNAYVYPNGYHASRLFWSTKHPRRKTVYHLLITIEQIYHQERGNHRTIEHPPSDEQLHVEQLYEACAQYFRKFQTKVCSPKADRAKPKDLPDVSQVRSSLLKCSTSRSALSSIVRPRDRLAAEKTAPSSEVIAIDAKTLRSLVADGSTNLSPLAVALAQALQHPADTKEHAPLFSYYLPHREHEQTAGEKIDVLLDQLLHATNSTDSADECSPTPPRASTGNTSVNLLQASIPQLDGNVDHSDEQVLPLAAAEELIERYQQWSASKFGHVKFVITSEDGYRSASEDLDKAWADVVDTVRACRDDLQLTHLPMSSKELHGHQVFGLTKPIVKIMLNQIYQRTFPVQQQNSPVVLPLSCSVKTDKGNSSFKRKFNRSKPGASHPRTNNYQRKSAQRPRFNWLSHPNRKVEHALESFECDEALVQAKRVLLEESSIRLRLYHLRYFSERALIVASSGIHGCGLFTLTDLVEGQMVIEYTGEVIRPCLTDKRERENERKDFGCYMFTVDSMNVIDATHQGNQARFINHHCQPNCFAKTVRSGGVKHIVIYALHDIERGSELTYDYSFPEEDVKIPCHCGTDKCRIYMN